MSLALSAVQRSYRDTLLDKISSGVYLFEPVPECICGSERWRALAQGDRYGLPVGVVICLDCGLVRTTPRLHRQHLAEFYEHEYHGLHQGVAEPDPDMALFRRGQGAAIHAFLGDLLPSGPVHVADVGAGTGQVLREFAAAHDGEVTGAGSEYAPAYVEAGQRAGSDIRCGGTDVLYDERRYDVVILSHVVEHFPDPVADLELVRALGGPATLFYVEVPGLLTIDAKPEYAYSFEQYLTLAHTFHFTLDTLADVMLRAGFALVRGAEAVHAVFRQATPVEPALDPEMAPRILASLDRLSSSRMHLRRLRPALRQRVAAMAKSVLPESAVQAIRSRRGG